MKEIKEYNGGLVQERMDTYEPGWIRVKFVDSGTYLYLEGPEIQEVASFLGATQTERVFKEGGKFRERRKKYGLHLWFDFYVGEEQPLTRSMSTLMEWPQIEVAELIPLARQTTKAEAFFSAWHPKYTSYAPGNSSVGGIPFNDPLIIRQWHYFNDGSTTSSVAGADANILPAWEVTTGNPSVIVAVIDGGIDFNHPDLAANMWVNPHEIPGNGEDDDDNGYVDDIYGYRFGKDGLINPSGEILPMDHGSHCAGVIGAVSNNGMGLAGIGGGNGDPSTGVRLMSCQTYVPDPAYPEDPYGNSKSTSQTPDAFAYAADNGAVIANCSFSYGGTSLSAAYKAGIDYFVDNAGTDENGNQTGPMRGGLMVAAAGNDGQEITKYPASYEKCISVAYSMSNYLVSPSSNYGPYVDITAPGGATSSSYAPGRVGGVFSTIPMQSRNYNVEQGYSYKSGTSMAAPHVAGIAALVLSAALENDISMNVEKLRNILERSCWDIYRYNDQKYAGGLGHGQIDAGFALQILLGDDDQPVETPQNLQTTTGTYQIQVSWLVPRDYFGNPVVSTEAYIGLRDLKDVDLTNLPAGIKKTSIQNNKAVGDTEEMVFSDLSPGTSYYFALIAIDRQKQWSEPLFFSAKTQPADDPSEPIEEGGFTVYPNPVKDHLFISFAEKYLGKKVEIQILNAIGHCVYSDEMQGSIEPYKIGVKRMAAGVYTVILKHYEEENHFTIIKH
ncbi:MAG: S8 family serine peptidase [Bacteroidales bacterium]|nr:S8 family serine peptidase [Bacteroidales bacterium]